MANTFGTDILIQAPDPASTTPDYKDKPSVPKHTSSPGGKREARSKTIHARC